MIKLFLLIVIVGAIYVGMNWEQISGQIDSGLATVEEVKDNAMDMKDAATGKIEDVKEKIEALVEK